MNQDNSTKNVLALDVGDRRIGVAMASLTARLSSPLLTIDRIDTVDVFERIKQLVNENDISTIIVGLPRDMESKETSQTASARQFADELKKLGIRVELQDEAGTSLQAEEELKSKNKSYNKGDIDKQAAAIILQDWLAGVTVEQL